MMFSNTTQLFDSTIALSTLAVLSRQDPGGMKMMCVHVFTCSLALHLYHHITPKNIYARIYEGLWSIKCHENIVKTHENQF